MDSKHFQHVEIKSADRGEVEAVFSTFNAIDSDGDVTLPGAFEDGAEVLISSYQHTSWSGVPPVGKGRIRTTDTEAILEGQFFMNIPAARDTFLVVKELGERQQWSYGFDVLEAEPGTFQGRDVRFLKRQLVHEVSPVLVGAGVGTRTLAAKAANSYGKEQPVAGSPEFKAAIRPHETPVTAKSWDAVATVAAIPDDASVSDLRTLFAWVDTDGDPEAKTNYRFPHHHGVGGEANLRACVTGIAVLNGARGVAGVPEKDRAGVYQHLAGHLVDADREPPELRAATGGPLKFHEEAAAALAGVSGLLDRAQEVVALRAQKGKGKALASASVDLLDWIHDDLRRLKSLIDSPQDDLAREFVRYIQSLQSGDVTP
jgi:hypothetical protein